MSCTIFRVDPEKIEAQLTVSSTSILSLIAFLFPLSYIIPEIPYLTKMDIFLYITHVLVFLALVESVSTRNLTVQSKHKTKKNSQAGQVFVSNNPLYYPYFYLCSVDYHAILLGYKTK